MGYGLWVMGYIFPGSSMAENKSLETTEVLVGCFVCLSVCLLVYLTVPSFPFLWWCLHRQWKCRQFFQSHLHFQMQRAFLSPPIAICKSCHCFTSISYSSFFSSLLSPDSLLAFLSIFCKEADYVYECIMYLWIYTEITHICI